jgi:hydroxyacylglutathione hydrolase
MLRIEGHILLPAFQTNTWLLWDDVSKEALLIDPSAPSQDMLLRIGELELKVLAIINTHGHGDHIGGNAFFHKELSVKVLIHTADAPLLTDNTKNFSALMGIPLTLEKADEHLTENTILTLGENNVKVIHTPGHTPGGICLLAGKFLISGDTLFEMSIGRTDLPGGSHAQIVSSIKDKLFILPDDTIVYPGHGPRTSIGMEKKNNPFIR